jgi:NAD(P)H dehydrogenase (quinone)
MLNPKILVTGATGRTGRVVVTQLLAKGWSVRAAVRVQDARSDLLHRRGAEVVVADIFDPVPADGRDARCAASLLLPPYHPFEIQSVAAFVAAARETVRRRRTLRQSEPIR